MTQIELKVARIGNSRGIRIPARTLERYEIRDAVWMEERSDGILLRPVGSTRAKLSWEDTAREMAASDEDWRAWEATAADGLEQIEWGTGKPVQVAERRARYGRRPRRKR